MSVQTIYSNTDLEADDRYVRRVGYWLRPIKATWVYSVFLYDVIDKCYVLIDGTPMNLEVIEVLTPEQITPSIREIATYVSKESDFAKNEEALSKLNRHCRNDRAFYYAELMRFTV